MTETQTEKRRWVQKSTFKFVALSLLSLLVMAGLAVLFSYLTIRPLREQVLDYAAHDASRFSRQITGRLALEDFKSPLTGRRLEDFDRFVKKQLAASGTAGIKLFNREGTLLYSSDPSRVDWGRANDPHLIASLRGGLVRGIRYAGDAPNEGNGISDNYGSAPSQDYIAVYVPVDSPGSDEVQGAIVVYEAYAPFREFMERERRTIFGANMVALAGLYVALVALAYYLWTDMKRQRWMLERKDAEVRAAGNVLSFVSHELRTPLHHIKGYATSLLRDDVGWGEKTRREFLEGIDREADRLNTLVSNLLDMSRLELDEPLSCQRGECDPVRVSRAALTRAAPFLSQHPVDVRAGSHFGPVWADCEHLERVLLNLLENASKFSEPGQPIVLELRDRKDGVEFHVADRGCGIPREQQAGLFQRFGRGQSVSGGPGGVGIGLAVCKSFVELNGGRIWLERSASGQGSDFAFWVPYGPAESRTR